MAKKKVDPSVAKARKQKRIAIAGGVIFLALVAIQGPKTLKMLRGPQPVAAPTATTTSAAPVAPAAGSTPSPDRGAVPGADGETHTQLVSLERFSGKDPFVPQINAGAVPGASGAPQEQPNPSAPKPQDPQITISPLPSAGEPRSSPAPSSTPPAPPARPTAAVIEVNDVPLTVSVTSEFPEGDAIFRLVALTQRTARIAVAGGAFASGDATITLRRGKAVTLMNTADGTRSELRLRSVTA